jgi:hypothetical protein
MKSKSRMILWSAVAASLAVAAFFVVSAASTTRAGSDVVVANEPTRASPIVDKPLAPHRSELLDIAFSAATRFPIKPHITTRSITQESVVATCFELDQPRRALQYIDRIDDWRRGKGYADYAFYCAQHGDTSEVRRYLDLARNVAQQWIQSPDMQEWQIGRIKMAIAKTQLVLGDSQEAAQLEAGTEPFVAESMETLKASRLSPEAFDVQMHVIEHVVAKGVFDETKSALESCAQLHKRFYDDPDRRKRTEETIKSSWAKLPMGIRVELMIELVNAALEHGDRAHATELVGETRALVESVPWLPEDRVPLMARLSALQYRAGDKEYARTELDAALAKYQAERDKIQSGFRARVLRPVAEAYASMGDQAGALAIYRIAVDEGSTNPNARPRAEDLCATCRSMAVAGVEPDAALRARIVELRDGLVDPW